MAPGLCSRIDVKITLCGPGCIEETTAKKMGPLLLLLSLSSAAASSYGSSPYSSGKGNETL